MNKQKKTYILLIAVLGIWGAIGFQIYQRMYPSVPELEELEVQNTFQKMPIVAASVYEIHEEYRDPFLGNYPKKKRAVINKKPKQEKPKIPFPEVIYHGISNMEVRY